MKRFLLFVGLAAELAVRADALPQAPEPPPAPAPLTKAIPPGFPPAPTGFRWVPDPRSPCGWHLVQDGVSLPAAATPAIAPKINPPGVATPAAFHTDPFAFPGGVCPPGRV